MESSHVACDECKESARVAAGCERALQTLRAEVLALRAEFEAERRANLTLRARIAVARPVSGF